MAIISGSAFADFIHRLGDGNIPPGGANVIATVTSGDDQISALGGDDTIHADSGNDTVFGGTGNDQIFGGLGSDSLDGGGGVDTLDGGTGDDIYVVDTPADLVVEAFGAGTDTVQSFVGYTLTLNVENLTLMGAANLTGVGNAGSNTLTGNDGNNALSGLDGADTLLGGIGDDTLNGGAGADSMVGGTGNDIHVVDDAGDVVVENAAEGTDTVQSFITFTLGNNFERLIMLGSGNITGIGNGSDNIINGNSGNNQLFGLDGSDAMSGGNGNDSLFGQVGNDTLDGQLGADSMVGSLGNDTYVIDNVGDVVVENAGEGTDTVQSFQSYTLGVNFEDLLLVGTANINGAGTAGANTLRGNSGNNQLFGLDGDDAITGGDGNDSLFGMNGNDTLDGQLGADSMTGGIGNDTYVIDNVGDVVVENAGEGTDTVQSFQSYTLGVNTENLTLLGGANINGAGNAANNVMTGNSGNNQLFGLDGNDTITGGVGNDTLFGQIGDDSMDGGAGNDSMTGGTGNDTYVIDSVGDAVIENAAEGLDVVRSGISYTLGANLENLILLGTTGLAGTGNALANGIAGTTGNDTLDGGAGADTMTGVLGDDTYIVDNAADVVNENAAEGFDVVRSAVSYTLGANLENLVLLGATGLAGTGNTQVNGIAGTTGNDTLDGGAGADFLIGGAGSDTYIVDNTGDAVTENAASGTDTVFASASHTLGDNVENLTLTAALLTGTGNSLANTMTGSSGNDTLLGEAGSDTIQGGNSDDRLDGGTSADSMVGGLGNDTYVVDNASDVVSEAAASGTDTIEALIGVTLGLNFENLLLLEAAGGVNGFGNTLDNVITGNSAGNDLRGSAGADTLSGGAGNDDMRGGNGTDQVFGGADDDVVRIEATAEFTAGEIYDGGFGNDTLNGSGVSGAVTLTTATVTSFESITGFAGGLTMTRGELLQFINGDINTGALTLTSNGVVDLSNARVFTDVINLAAGGNTVTLDAGQGYFEGRFNGTVNGGAGADSMTIVTGGYGTYGTTLNGLGGNDTLTGGNGYDAITGGADNDSLTGGYGNDTLDGGAGVDVVFGGYGDDRLRITDAAHVTGAEIYDGGLGDDTLDGTGAASTTDLTNATISSIESITGFAGGLTIARGALDGLSGDLNTGVLTIFGSGAVDLSNARVFTDVINLAAGGNAITLDAGSGYYEGKFNGTVNGGSGADSVTVLSPVSFYGTYGTTLNGFGGNDTLTGGDGYDAITGGVDNDSLTGGYGNDTLDGGAGADSVFGGYGDDRLIITDAAHTTGAEAYEGGLGNDTLDGTAVGAVDLSAAMISSIESITGFAGGLTIARSALDGLPGALDTGVLTIFGSGAVDLSNARVLTDVINLAAGGNALTLDAGTGYYEGRFNGTVNGGAGADSMTIVAGGYGTYGTTLNGFGGNDTLTGGNGYDTLDGGAGVDSVFGGYGDDRLVITDAAHTTGAEAYDGGLGNDTLDGTAVGAVDLSAATISSIETITGFAGGLTMTQSQLSGFAGTLDTGALTISSGGIVDLSGARVLTDVINLAAGGNAITLNAGTGFYEGRFNGTVNGGAGADSMTIVTGGYGTYGTTLNGFGGNDTLTGSNGYDAINGGADNDSLTGGYGSDTLDGGADNDSLFGETGADSLIGGAGNDSLFGGSGYYSDTLAGGAGNDVLDGTGSGGSDVFDFSAADNGGADVINGFAGFGTYGYSIDQIRITGGNTGPNYIGGYGFSNAGTTEVRFTGTLLQVDMDGNGSSDFTITVTGMVAATDLDSFDFI